MASASRRIRLQSAPPLPSFRIWFLVSQEITDIKSLKLSLCSQIATLKDVRPPQLILEMDDFELLEDSSIDLVREGDLLMLKRQNPAADNTPAPGTLKRKPDADKSTRSPKRRRLSISSSSSSSSTSSLDSSSTSNNSTSSSASSSDLTHSSECPVVSIGTRKPTHISAVSRGVAPHIKTSYNSVPQPTVPPGFGKASTHSRNNRRKIRRKFTTTQASSSSGPVQPTKAGDKDDFDASENTIVESQTKPFATPPSVFRTSSSSLGNRNKSKDFKKAMEGAVPKKIVFNPNALLPSPATTHQSSMQTFIRPSERKYLPKNVFVTSVDIEWRTNKVRQSQDIDNEEASEEVLVDATVVLDPDQQARDWDAVETHWVKYREFNASVTLSLGSIVAWKAFGLDPVTLTPQASMLHMGKVISADPQNILIQLLTRPGVGHAAFGRATVKEDQDIGEQLSISLEEAHRSNWRVVSTP